MAAGRVSRDGVAALEGLAIGELYEALGSATTPDDIEAQVLQLSENRSDPSALRQHFDSAEVVSNGSVTPPGFDTPFSYSTIAGGCSPMRGATHANLRSQSPAKPASYHGTGQWFTDHGATG
jgi:hypothetical protein